MKRLLLLLLTVFLARPLAAQDLGRNLKEFVETPAIPGYERALARKIRGKLMGFSPESDNLGDISLTLGSGAPHRLIVAPLDEPGYVVSGITEDGYLRVQRLPQQLPNGLFDQLYAAQPVLIETRGGKWVNGVVAGLSVHLQPARRNSPAADHPDEMYIDIGASTAAEVREAGVDLLNPVVLDRQLYSLGFGRMTAASVGDRFGAAALVELARRLDPTKMKGTLTIAFVTEQWAGARGLERLLERTKAGEMIYVGRLLPQRAPASAAAGAGAGVRFRVPLHEPGSGVLVGTSDPEGALSSFSDEIMKLAKANSIPVAPDFAAPVLPSSYLPGPALPERFAHVGIAVAWPATPAELVHSHDVWNLVNLLEAYAQGSVTPEAAEAQKPLTPPPLPARRRTAPAVPQTLQTLVETYGVSGHESRVRETIERLLPAWAKPGSDAAGNLVLHLGSRGAGAHTLRILFVAHMDEIGFEVKSIAEDGRLLVEWRGGGNIEFFGGHPVLVQTASGIRPGVMELPSGWQQPDFRWPHQQAFLRVDVGARTAAEVEQLGIRAGDWLTVPKKYRRLAATRASGRSFDDRVGDTALVAAVWALGPELKGRDVTFAWSTEEEVGLRGAFALAQELAAEGRSPDYVFAVDTFVSSDSPLESKRFADARVGQGFVVRAVDNSNLVPVELVDRVVRLARADKIPVQYGVTGGGNDGAAFLRFGSIDVALGWPLRYSHSPGEVVDTRDVEALGRIVADIARSW